MIDFLFIVIIPVIIISIIAFGYIYGVKKKRVEKALYELANKTKLTYDKHRLRYSFVKGEYQGFEVEVGVYNGYNIGKGLTGFILTGKGSMTAMGITNFSAIKLKHKKPIKKKRIKSNIIITENELILNYPIVVEDSSTLKKGLDKLVTLAKKL